MTPCPHCGLDSHEGPACPRWIFLEGQRRILDRRRTARPGRGSDPAAMRAAIEAVRVTWTEQSRQDRAQIERQRLEIQRLKDSLGRARAVLRFYRDLVDDVVETIDGPARKQPARVH